MIFFTFFVSSIVDIRESPVMVLGWYQLINDYEPKYLMFTTWAGL